MLGTSPHHLSQESPGVTELPHTRTRTVHWLSTAVALAAVLGLSSLIQPPAATARPAPTAAAGTGPDPAGVRYPVNCGTGPGARVDVVDKAAADFDGDGRTETVAVVRCHSGAGTPPSGLYVLAGGNSQGGHPRIAATLVANREGMSVQNLRVSGHTVHAKLFGYSSPSVPRCCPDRQRNVKWEWRDGKFALKPAPAQGASTNV
jgi:hypothetical protein